jgi:hypothetical protein
VQPFDQAVDEPIVTTSGNNQLLQSSDTPFNVHDAEIMKSSLDSLLIQELLPSMSVPPQIS